MMSMARGTVQHKGQIATEWLGNMSHIGREIGDKKHTCKSVFVFGGWDRFRLADYSLPTDLNI